VPESSALCLTDVREEDVLPLRETVEDFIEPTHRLGRFQLLEGQWWRASRWHAGVIPPEPGGTRPEWWSEDPIISCSPLSLFRVPDALYIPSFGAVISSSGHLFRTAVGQARYRTPDLTLMPGVIRDGETTYLTPSQNLPALKQAIVTMPWGAHHNYGHFVLDCLSGLAAAIELSELSGYVPVFPSLKPWQLRHLELLGVDHILQLDHDVYRVEDLIFSSSMASFLHHPNLNYRTLRRRQVDRIQDSVLSNAKVYVARPTILKRNFLTDQELRTALEENGFMTIYPEQHTVDEQIAIFRNARVVVGCAGAAFANVLYCEPDTRIVEIIPMRMVEGQPVSGVWVYNICALLGLLWRPYFTAMCWPDEAATQERPELDFSYKLDVDDFMEYLRELRG
jgi:capsular polysaccharide biosynthesis protein